MAPFVFLVVLLSLLQGCGGPAMNLTDTIEAFRVGDREIACRRIEPDVSKANGVRIVLLHGDGADGSVWNGFAEHLARLGYGVLVPSLSADSTPGEARDILTSLLHQAGSVASAGRAGKSRVVVMGEGSGANLALEWGKGVPGAGALVLLSPATTWAGLNAVATMREFTHCPVFLVAAENDSRAATAAMQLKDAAPAFCEIQIYPGSTHGADIFAMRPEVMTAISDWLALILAPDNAGV